MTGYVYGIAYYHTMCSERSVGVNQDRRPAIKFIGVTVAHEMGHILNMGHDDGGTILFTFTSSFMCILTFTLTCNMMTITVPCDLNSMAMFLACVCEI